MTIRELMDREDWEEIKFLIFDEASGIINVPEELSLNPNFKVYDTLASLDWKVKERPYIGSSRTVEFGDVKLRVWGDYFEDSHTACLKFKFSK